MVNINKSMCVSIKNKFNYFGDTTSLHGIRNVFSMSRIPFLKRLFWSGILMSCCFGAGSVLRTVLKLFSTGVASYAVETNYLDWDTPFPAVTICDTSDNNRIMEYLKQNKKFESLYLFYIDVTYWNVKYCKLCDNSCEVKHKCENNFEHHVKEIRHKCEELLTDCWWGGKYFRCCDLFRPMRTEYGECYVFNSALLGNASVQILNKVNGLSDLLFTAVKTVSVILHPPDDTISAAYENILGSEFKLSFISEYEAILKAEQTVSDTSLISLPVSMRNCLFKKERPSLEGWPFQHYTYSACSLYCRLLGQIKACNCSHHFMTDMFGTPACNTQGLLCLSKNKEKISSNPCDCPNSCDDTQYKVVHIFDERVAKSPEMIKRGSRARIRFAQLPTLRVRRLAIKDTLGVVVDIGGVGGVFFGASLLSVIELVYLFCIRRNRSTED